MYKKSKIIVLLSLGLLSIQAQAQNPWAIGFKIGEPLGINVRKYIHNGTNALEFNAGTYGFVYGTERSYNKNKYYSSTGIMYQGYYYWIKPLGKKGNFDTYYGVGGQINSRRRTDNTGERLTIRSISLGPSGNVGIETKIPQHERISIFLDSGLYMELAPKIFFGNLQFNIGLRTKI